MPASPEQGSVQRRRHDSSSQSFERTEANKKAKVPRLVLDAAPLVLSPRRFYLTFFFLFAALFYVLSTATGTSRILNSRSKHHMLLLLPIFGFLCLSCNAKETARHGVLAHMGKCTYYENTF
jgi:hypothetical protein